VLGCLVKVVATNKALWACARRGVSLSTVSGAAGHCRRAVGVRRGRKVADDCLRARLLQAGTGNQSERGAGDVGFRAITAARTYDRGAALVAAKEVTDGSAGHECDQHKLECETQHATKVIMEAQKTWGTDER